MQVSVIVLAAGKSSRLKAKISKPLVKINAKPIICYCLEVFCRHPEIREIVIAAGKQNYELLKRQLRKYKFSKIRTIVFGGARRQDSVRNALLAISPDPGLVLIHDAARPFIDKDMVSALINKAKEWGAAVVGVPVKATIKEVVSRQSLVVRKTLDRRKLWEIQTPQAFKKEIICKAYKKFGHISVTDDAALVEKLGKKVALVSGSYRNIKITTPEDLVIAQAIAKFKG